MCVNNLPKVVNWKRKAENRTRDLRPSQSQVQRHSRYAMLPGRESSTKITQYLIQRVQNARTVKKHKQLHSLITYQKIVDNVFTPTATGDSDVVLQTRN